MVWCIFELVYMVFLLCLREEQMLEREVLSNIRRPGTYTYRCFKI
jgi:hypothetical protein